VRYRQTDRQTDRWTDGRTDGRARPVMRPTRTTRLHVRNIAQHREDDSVWLYCSIQKYKDQFSFLRDAKFIRELENDRQRTSTVSIVSVVL